MRIVSEAEASKDLKALLDHVVGDADITVITRPDDKAAVVMGRDHYNSLMETLYLLESPANAEHLARSVEQFKGRDKI
ncbi:MAG: type II toxin-antitoxin system Phd/YefM family antitoxin [Pseudomonadota bacterium]|nr:type II toxin-antitoxin system Phd/YefM family antitoxin [Pseudomonadota bacterium]